nr:hypothetical protein [Tanacetum cinerariifolium]
VYLSTLSSLTEKIIVAATRLCRVIWVCSSGNRFMSVSDQFAFSTKKVKPGYQEGDTRCHYEMVRLCLGSGSFSCGYVKGLVCKRVARVEGEDKIGRFNMGHIDRWCSFISKGIFSSIAQTVMWFYFLHFKQQ